MARVTHILNSRLCWEKLDAERGLSRRTVGRPGVSWSRQGASTGRPDPLYSLPGRRPILNYVFLFSATAAPIQ